MDSNNDTPLGFWGTESEEVISKQFPLHKACRDGDAVALSRLVAIATPDQMVAEDQFYGWTPIHWAAYFGKIDCLNGLLRTGVSVNIRTSRFKQTPAHISAFGGHPTALLELMKAGADFHARDYLGESPMHKAARVGNVECIKVLVTSGAHANICNDNGHTAGDLASMQNFIECARVLESAVANLTPIHAVNGFANGNSGAHVSNGNGHGPITNGGNGHVNGHQPMTNGWSGHVNEHHPITNGCSMRKRGYDDESIPSLKRARVAEPFQHLQQPRFHGDQQLHVAVDHNTDNSAAIFNLKQRSTSSHIQDTDCGMMTSDSSMDDCGTIDTPSSQVAGVRGSFYAQYLIERQMEMFHGS